MSTSNPNLLIDHLDKTLQGESVPEAEALIARDAAAREQWQSLQTAVSAVQHAALYQQVAAIRTEMEAAGNARPQRGIVRNLRNVMRVAAAIILLTGVFAVYKYTSVTPAGLYQDHYTSFELRTVRGEGDRTALQQSYRNAQWQAVIDAYEATPARSAEDHFLAGTANMELKQFPQAIQLFNTLLENNRRNGETAYRDQAEYYLAMAYLANNQPDEGIALIRKIRQDENHPYYQKAGGISGLDMKILQFK